MQVIEQWLISTRQFTIRARVNFFQSIIINLCKIGIGVVNPIVSPLIILSAFGNALKAAMMFLFARKSTYKSDVQEKENVKFSPLELAKEYRDFPMYRAPESYFSKFSQPLLVLMLTAFLVPLRLDFIL